MIPNRNKLGILITALLLMVFAISRADNNFEILESADDHILLKFTLPEWTLEAVEENDFSRQKINCPEGVNKSKGGEPELPGFVCNAGIPPDGDLEVSIISSVSHVLRDIVLRAVWTDKVDNDELIYNYEENETIYNSNSFFPALPARRGYAAFSGDRQFCSVIVQPFQYNGKQQKLKYYSELIIRLDISGTFENYRGLRAGSLLDKVGTDFLVNNEYSRNWCLPRNEDESIPERSSGLVKRYMMTIDSEGIYKVSYGFITNSLGNYAEFYAAGFNWDSVDPRYLELSNRGGTIPIHFSGEADGSFDPGDYFEFYADINHGETAWYDDYGSDNVYYLELTDHLGSRMTIENGGLIQSDPSNYILPESFEQTVHIEHQNFKEHLGAQTLYDLGYFREDLWFWGSIMAPDLTEFSFELEYPHISNIRKASAQVCLMGLTFDDRIDYLYLPTDQNLHRAIVRINSALVDDIGSDGEWLGQHEQIFANMGYSGSEIPILNSDLSHGSNFLSVSLPNLENQYERVLLDYLDLTYWREYKTNTDLIKFHKPVLKPIGTTQPGGLYQFDLDGFSSENVSIYKLGSSKMSNMTVLSLSESGKAPYRISFQDSVFSDEIKYIALTEEMKKEPDNIVPDHPSGLRSSANGAEYVIITVREFGEGARLFEEFWENEKPGLEVEVVYVQDIFDEYNNGLRSAEAIRDFLEYAYNNWSPRPSHCLLLGEGLLDERSNSPYGWANKVPTKVIWFDARGATASDNWYGCLSGNDIVADISISRLNVTQSQQVEQLLTKTEHYMTESAYDDLWHSSITLATGGKSSEGNIFSMQSERIKNNSVPPEYRVSRVYCNTTGLPDSYGGNTTTLINSINEGTMYVQFMGHGASHQWDDYDLFDIYDVGNLNNSNYFIASSMSCYGSAFFDDAGESCIGEALTLDSQGAIAHIGFTGFGWLNEDEIYSRALLAALTNPELETIGEIIDYTKIRFYSESGDASIRLSLIHGSALLGDPMIEIKRPELGVPVHTNKFNFALEDSLILRAEVGNDIERGRFYLYDKNDAPVSANEFYPFTYDAASGEVISNALIPDETILPEGEYTRFVKFAGYSQGREVLGLSSFTIGYSGAVNLHWLPSEPTPADDIEILSDFYDPYGVDSVSCYVRIYNAGRDPFKDNAIPNTQYHQEMIWDEELSTYRLLEPISALPYRYSVLLDFTITDTLGNSSVCELLPGQKCFRITGVKFKLSDFSITSLDNKPMARVSVTNNGNRNSEACDLKIYRQGGSLLDSLRIDGLETGEQRWEYLQLPLLNERVIFSVVLNEDEEFPGTAQLNTSEYELQLFEAGVEEFSITSLDSCLVCNFPDMLLSEKGIFKLEKIGSLAAVNQPDISPIQLNSGDFSSAYDLSCLNESLLKDTLGTYPSGNGVELVFSYSQNRFKKNNRDSERYSVYRWNERYKKWSFLSIGANEIEETVSFTAGKTGIYTIYNNQDKTSPAIDVNVEGQEFTYGGYVSQNGIISFVLGDKNGVNVIEKDLIFSIDGAMVERDEYSINTATGSLISIPVKYQLNNIAEGIHYLQMSCQDFNGNVYNRELSFEVKADFDIIKIGNYPNPVKSMTIDPINTGRTRFTYVLTDDADELTIKVYTVSGRLVKTFDNLSASIGYHEYPGSNIGWDCRDEKGSYLANGVYFYKVIARKGNEEIEKIQKMAILK